ncbi:hypothetical protein [Thioclava marina]|uniref:hypothetical protein n=1 Tax=Thioclava marina TaxID=1915077 RepID=UPI0011BA48C0|nr:hypothetical protein [Thioclava marina]
MKTADWAAATAQSAALVPISGYVRLHAPPGGDVCSLARRISYFREAGACMKPAYRREVFMPLCVLASDELGMPWEFMARKKKFAEKWEEITPKGHQELRPSGKTCFIWHEFSDSTPYLVAKLGWVKFPEDSNFFQKIDPSTPFVAKISQGPSLKPPITKG